MEAISLRDNWACGRGLTLTLLPWSKLSIWFLSNSSSRTFWTSWLVLACVSNVFVVMMKMVVGVFACETPCAPCAVHLQGNFEKIQTTLDPTTWMTWNEAVVYSTCSGGTTRMRKLHKFVESPTEESIL